MNEISNKKDNSKYGEVIAMLRASKGMGLKEMTGDDFTVSQLAKFEKGETNITVNKFFTLLKNSNIYLDEFQHIYNDYAVSEEITFQQDLVKAYSRRDFEKIEGILNFWKTKVINEPNNRGYRLNEIVVKSVLDSARGTHLTKKEILYLTEYLDSIKEWGRYEIWIFGNCLRHMDNESLKYYGDYILGRTNFYQTIHLNKQMTIRTLLNMIDTFLKRNNLSSAKKYINHLDQMNIPIDYFYEKIIFKYHVAFFEYLQKGDKSKSNMLKYAQIIKDVGYKQESDVLFEEIKSL